MSGASGRNIPILRGAAGRAWVESARTPAPDAGMREAVARIIEQVREGGDSSLFDLAEKFDGARPTALRVPRDRCLAALDSLSNHRRDALEFALANITRFHEARVRTEEPIEVVHGVRSWREFRPIDRIGVYAPGGRAAYPSSVLMAVAPARIAGVGEIAVCCPGGPAGIPPESVLAACALLDVDEVFSVGGAQAIAALAIGTRSIRAVDKIFGPGGAWVNAAKLALYPEVEIDIPAGPSEVVVWADLSADPLFVASELVAQAEHGPDSSAICILSDPADDCGRRLELLAERIADDVARSLAELSGGPTVGSARESLAASAIVVCEDDKTGEEQVNDLASEHLVLLRKNPAVDLSRIRHAGSVFLGPWSPVAAGDYASGTNHVLPTGRRARATSGLCLDDFGRWLQVQEIDRGGLAALAPTIETLAEWEGLPAHAASVRARRVGER